MKSPTCPICAGKHVYAECTDHTPKCSNCGGAHSAAYNKCPKYIQSAEVTRVVATTGISYRDAVARLGGALQPPSRLPQPSQTGSDPDIEQAAVTKGVQTVALPPPLTSLLNPLMKLQIKRFSSIATQTEEDIVLSINNTSTQEAQTDQIDYTKDSTQAASVVKNYNNNTADKNNKDVQVVQHNHNDVTDFIKTVVNTLNRGGADRRGCGSDIMKSAITLFKLSKEEQKMLNMGTILNKVTKNTNNNV